MVPTTDDFQVSQRLLDHKKKANQTDSHPWIFVGEIETKIWLVMSEHSRGVYAAFFFPYITHISYGRLLLAL